MTFFQMTRAERKLYNRVISSVFLGAFLLFGAMTFLFWTHPFASPADGPFPGLPPLIRGVLSFIAFGLLGGWFIAGQVGGVWLVGRYLIRQPRSTLILACVFFFLTFYAFMLTGLLLAIPFAIYNAVILRRSKGLPEEEPEPIPQPTEAPPKKRSTRFHLFATSFICILLFLAAAFHLYQTHLANRFFPTPAEAFARHPDTSGTLGEIFFLDEHETNLTILSLRGDQLVVSHYITELRDGERWYNSQGTSGHITLHFFDTARFSLHFLLTDEGIGGRANRYFRETLGRRPLYGTYRHVFVRDLSINGIPVDHVFEHTTASGEQVFFWYISDFPPVTGPREDIIISFDPARIDPQLKRNGDTP